MSCDHLHITIYLTMGKTDCVRNSIIIKITLSLHFREWNKLKSSGLLPSGTAGSRKIPFYGFLVTITWDARLHSTHAAAHLTHKNICCWDILPAQFALCRYAPVLCVQCMIHEDTVLLGNSTWTGTEKLPRNYRLE